MSANSIADRSPVEGKAACFGRAEKPIVVDAEPVMNAVALLDDLERSVRAGTLSQRISSVKCRIRDSIASHERQIVA